MINIYDRSRISIMIRFLKLQFTVVSWNGKVCSMQQDVISHQIVPENFKAVL